VWGFLKYEVERGEGETRGDRTEGRGARRGRGAIITDLYKKLRLTLAPTLNKGVLMGHYYHTYHYRVLSTSLELNKNHRLSGIRTPWD